MEAAILKATISEVIRNKNYNVKNKNKNKNEIEFYILAYFWWEGYSYLCHLSVHPSKSCLSQYSETIHDSCFIFSGQINLVWNLYNARSYWPWKYDIHFQMFSLAIIFRVHQPAMGPVYCGVILTFNLDIIAVILKIVMTFTIQILSRPELWNYKW